MQGALSGGDSTQQAMEESNPVPYPSTFRERLRRPLVGHSPGPSFPRGCCYVSILAEAKAPCQTRTKATPLR